MAKPSVTQLGGGITDNKPLFFGLIFLVLVIIYLLVEYFACVPFGFFGKCDDES